MTEAIHPKRFQALIAAAQAAEFSGWDFSWLSGRMVESNPPWDYVQLVQAYLGGAGSLLDMGTGGGEFLASLAPLPPNTHATESYPPNQPIASRRLSPLGVRVHHTAEDTPLPFEGKVFDLVINRHESYDPGEVYRILKPGGTFITQQVGELDNLEINQFLQKDVPYLLDDWGIESEVLRLVDAGFFIQQAEKAALKTTFRDIGALVYYLRAIPWQVEGFTVETHLDPLVRLHNYIELQGEFITTAHRFLLIAQKEA